MPAISISFYCVSLCLYLACLKSLLRRQAFSLSIYSENCWCAQSVCKKSKSTSSILKGCLLIYILNHFLFFERMLLYIVFIVTRFHHIILHIARIKLAQRASCLLVGFLISKTLHRKFRFVGKTLQRKFRFAKPRLGHANLANFARLETVKFYILIGIS